MKIQNQQAILSMFTVKNFILSNKSYINSNGLFRVDKLILNDMSKIVSTLGL